MTDVFFKNRLKQKGIICIYIYIWRRSDACNVHTLPYRTSETNCHACQSLLGGGHHKMN